MGSGDKLIQWIHTCISTIRFAILINGDPEGFFKLQRGLRQGGPLSPHLFVKVMEAPSLLLKRAKSLRWLEGFQIDGKK